MTMKWVHLKNMSIGEDKDGDGFMLVQEFDGLWRGMSTLVGQGVVFATRRAGVEAAEQRYAQVKGGESDNRPVDRPVMPIGHKLN